MRALAKEVTTQALEEVARHVTDNVNNARAQAAAILVPPVQRALVARNVAPTVCTFCGKRNHAEVTCRARQAAIQAMTDGRHQARAESKSTRRPVSDGAGAPRTDRDRTCYKCGHAGHLKRDCKVVKKEKVAAATLVAAADDEDEESDNQDSDSKHKILFAYMIGKTQYSCSVRAKDVPHLSSRVGLDTMASIHVTNDLSRLQMIRRLEPRARFSLQGVGPVQCRIDTVGRMVLASGVVLSRVYYCPSAPLSLISMSRLLEEGHVPRMEHNAVVVSDPCGREVLRAQSDEGLFLLAPHMPAHKSAIACPVSSVPTRQPSVRIARQSARVVAPGNSAVQLPARAAGASTPAQAAGARVHDAGRPASVPTPVVRSAPLRARLMAMRDVLHVNERRAASVPTCEVRSAPLRARLMAMRDVLHVKERTAAEALRPKFHTVVPGTDTAPLRSKILHSTAVQLHVAPPPGSDEDLGCPGPGETSTSDIFEPYSVAQCRKYRVFIQHHNRLHLSIRKLRAMASVHNIDLGKIPAELNCAACHAGKGHRLPLKDVVRPGIKVGADDRGDRILYDSRELTVAAWDNLRYVTLLKSQKHGYFWILLARTKDEMPAKIIQWGKMYEAHYSSRHGPIKSRRHDAGTDIDTLATQTYWASVGNVHDAMPVYPGGLNGGSESGNWVIFEHARALIFAAPHLDAIFAPFALQAAVQEMNLIPTKQAPQTYPLLSLEGTAAVLPSIKDRVVYGARGYFTPAKENPSFPRTTWSARRYPCVFLCYADSLRSLKHVLVEGPTCSLVVRNSNDCVFPGVDSVEAVPLSLVRFRPFDWLTGCTTDFEGRAYYFGKHATECFTCHNATRGGDVILCDYCRHASHCKCAGLARIPSGRFTCSVCVAEQVAANARLPDRAATVASILVGDNISGEAPAQVKVVRTSFSQIKKNKLDRRLAKVLARNELPQSRDVSQFGSDSVQDRASQVCPAERAALFSEPVEAVLDSQWWYPVSELSVFAFVGASVALPPTQGEIPARIGERFRLSARALLRKGFTHSQSMARPDSDKARLAERKEWDTCLKAKAFDIVPFQEGMEVFDSKFLNTIHPVTGEHSSRFLRRGDQQGAGSYDPRQISAEMVESLSVRIGQAYAANKPGYKSVDVDYSRAFLQAALGTAAPRPIHLKAPDGMGVPPGYVLLMHQALYGLLQSPHAWGKVLDGEMKHLNLVAVPWDPKAFTLKTLSGMLFAFWHVDDGKIIGPIAEVDRIVAELGSRYRITVKEASVKFCGIDYAYRNFDRAYFRHMNTKIEALIAGCIASGVQLAGRSCPRSPMVEGTEGALEILGDKSVPAANDRWYRWAIGLSIWIAHEARLDISSAIRILSHATGRNLPPHDAALVHMILYLKGTSTYGLPYGTQCETEPRLVLFADASLANLPGAKSANGLLFKYNNCVVLHEASTQSCVAMDTAESEYVTVSTGARKAMGILNMLSGMGISHSQPVLVYEDNTAAIDMVKSPYIKRGARHIDIRVNKIRELHEKMLLEIVHISSAKQEADGLTKILSPVMFEAWRASTGMCSMEDFKQP